MKCAQCGKEGAGVAGWCTHCGMPVAAVPRSVWLRAVGAVAAGSLIYLSTLYRGLTYAQRMGGPCRPPPDNTYMAGGRVLLRPCDPGFPYVIFIFAGLMLVAGFVLTLRTPRLRYTIASLLLAGVFAGLWHVMMIDWRIDPTDHNLLPFEFVILAVEAAPAYLGAAFAHAVDAYTERASSGRG